VSLSRRGFIRLTYATAGVATVVTAGETVIPLKDLSVLAPRVPDIGVQHFPVNRTAHAANITPAVVDGYTLIVEGPHPLVISLAQLRAMPQHDAHLPISCVEGWSSQQRWTGVRVRDLLDLARVPHARRIRVESLEAHGAYASSILDHTHARDPLTLLALKVGGEQLALDHGYPARLISPDRPGVLQTKWVGKLVAL
jgi:DMSO/TMAO reductase YedYZ molybdopterin-dependent catalytic subunit